jgi:alkylhydroperoxidase family enzyme
MPRIPFPDIAKAGDEVRETLGRLPGEVGIFNMLAHAETLLKPTMRLGGAMLGKMKLDPLLRELALLHAVKLEGGEYEWVQHVPVAKKLGATDAQITALEKGDVAASCFSTKERSVLQFTGEVVIQVKASDAALAAVRQHLSDREVVKLIMMAGFYIMLARLTETTGVEIEPPQGQAIVDQIEARLKARAARPAG